MSYFSKLIGSDDNVNSLDFSPSRDLLLSSSISGDLSIYSIDTENASVVRDWSNSRIHRMSVRSAKFSKRGTEILSVSADKTVALTDIEKNTCTWRGKGHGDGISVFCCINEDTIATGDDDGEIRIWDIRSGKSAPSVKIKEFYDVISGVIPGNSKHELLAIRLSNAKTDNNIISYSGDQIGSFDLKTGKLIAMSDNIEDELLCISMVKSGKKVVCGTVTGMICFFSYGFWGDINDLMTVNKNTVSSIVNLNEDVVCATGDDGEVHVISIHPNKVAGQLQNYKKLGQSVNTTESLTMNHDKSLLAFVGEFEHIYITEASEAFKLLSKNDDDFFDEL